MTKNEQLPQIFIPGVSSETPVSQPLIIHHVFIIDASGSMSGIKPSTITGFNEQVQNIRQLERANPTHVNKITLTFFSGENNTRFFDAPSSSLQELADDDYICAGSTRLYATVGEVLTRLKDGLTEEQLKNERVIVTIITDGEDNASGQAGWSQHRLASCLAEWQKDHNWVITFIGANIDVTRISQDLFIPVSNTIAYSASTLSTGRAFAASNHARSSYVTRAALGDLCSKGYFCSTSDNTGLDVRDEKDKT